MSSCLINHGQSKSMILIDIANSLEASGLNYKKCYKILMQIHVKTIKC